MLWAIPYGLAVTWVNLPSPSPSRWQWHRVRGTFPITRRISGDCCALVSVGEAPNSPFPHVKSTGRSGGPFWGEYLDPSPPCKACPHHWQQFSMPLPRPRNAASVSDEGCLCDLQMELEKQEEKAMLLLLVTASVLHSETIALDVYGDTWCNVWIRKHTRCVPPVTCRAPIVP